MENRPEPDTTYVGSTASRARLIATVERWAFGAGIATGALRAVLADVVNAIKNSGRAFGEAHRKAYSQKHLVKRRL